MFENRLLSPEEAHAAFTPHPYELRETGGRWGHIALQAKVAETGEITEVYVDDTYVGVVATYGTLDDEGWPHNWISVYTNPADLGRPHRGCETWHADAVAQLVLEHNRQQH